MIYGNPALGPHLFPERAEDLLTSVHEVPGVSQLYGEMRGFHEQTADHMESVALFSAALVLECLDPDLEDREFSKRIVLAALLHDIGKTHPDILPLIDVEGWYTDSQRETMRKHTMYGAEQLFRYADIRDDGLVPDIVFLHHADSKQVDSYIQDRNYGKEYAHRLCTGITIVSTADVFEATLPIGDENSHSTFGDRDLPLSIVEHEIYKPHRDKLPDIAIKDTVFHVAQAYARLRVAQYEAETVSVA